MAAICPTITAFDSHDYRAQMERLEPFAKRIHIDLMDGEFAPTKSPDLEHIWWPYELIADIHLMYQRPMEHIDQLIKLKPHMVVIHNEADVHHMDFAARLHRHDIEVGLAILKDTPIEWAHQIMHSFDQILIFSGNLGHQGGSAVDFGLLDKVRYVHEHHPEAEVAWDGGINADNARQLAEGGVEVLNVGGFIMHADDPAAAYKTIVAAAT
jgi:ribulose-phosphate 3-epimerase